MHPVSTYDAVQSTLLCVGSHIELRQAEKQVMTPLRSLVNGVQRGNRPKWHHHQPRLQALTASSWHGAGIAE